MNQNTQVPNQKLAMLTTEQVSVLANRVLLLAKTKQLTLMIFFFEIRELLKSC
jgi:hypothetical protein